MKLQAKYDESRVIYALSTWEWDSKKQTLIQRVPIIGEIKFTISKKQQVFNHFPKEYHVPTLWEGQLVKLDGRDMYVANIEIAYFPKETVFVYQMSETKPEIPTWWTVEVKECKKEVNDEP